MQRLSSFPMLTLGCALICLSPQAGAQIEPADDAPPALSPEQSLLCFELPSGFELQLLASEPLIEEPSGVCWDASSRLYVCELHGYNLEGQYDIEALNRTGKLDRKVRRIQADPAAKEKALSGTYGRIKLLSDLNGDGRMDQAQIFADGLPPCFGMVAARGGLIVACAPHILFLKDNDGDGKADQQEILFTGFEEGVLERRINAPQWGLDNWIYLGGGGRADQITGPGLDQPVNLGRTDFRIRADGSAIEAVEGSTGTFGHTFTAEGDRLTISTGTPGYQVLPIPWGYLTRNPFLSVGRLERNAAGYQETFPISSPHPWRTRRYEDPGFSEYYTERYGKAESIPSGYFTSACSPFIYRDTAFPVAYHGANFSCEPAQNLIHQSSLHWQGTHLNLLRGGAKAGASEVIEWALAQKTRPMPSLPEASQWEVLGPLRKKDGGSLLETAFEPEKQWDWDGNLQGHRWESRPSFEDGQVIDLGLPEQSAIYLRRILEADQDKQLFLSLGSNDAIQCWLNGRKIHENNINRSAAPDQDIIPLNLRKGPNRLLMKIVNGTNASGFYFRMQATALPPRVSDILSVSASQWSEGQIQLLAETHASIQAAANQHEFLASKDSWFHPMNLTHAPDGSIVITDFYREIIEDYSAIPRYLQQQYGLNHGMHHGRLWRLTHSESPPHTARIPSSLKPRQLASMLASERVWERESAQRLLIEQGATEARDEILNHLVTSSRQESAIAALYTLEGLGQTDAASMELALNHPNWAVRRHALRVGDQYPAGHPVHQQTARWLEDVTHYINEPRLLIQIALSLGSFEQTEALNGLAYLATEHRSLPWMDLAILSSSAGREDALLSRLLRLNPTGSPISESLVALMATREDRIQLHKAIAAVKSLAHGESQTLYLAILRSALDPKPAPQRLELEAIQAPDAATLETIEAKWPAFLEALSQKEVSRPSGEALFTEHCSSCHQAKGIGSLVGPNLDSEFQRAPETILRDILFPHETITQGFQTLRLSMKQGADVIGILASESPTSVTLQFPGGESRTFLRSRIAKVHQDSVSLMPAQFGWTLEPSETAAIIAFLTQRSRDGSSESKP